MTTADVLRVEVESGILTLTVSSAATRNALSVEILAGIAQALRAADRDLNGAVLTGAGGVFSAGADFRSLRGTEEDVQFDDRVTDVVAAIGECPWPVVAAIEGPCMGAAVDIALACDLRIVAARAFFEVPAAHLGIIYSPTSIRRMQARYADATLRRLLLLGERIGAEDALVAGLASHRAEEGRTQAEARSILAGRRPRSVDAVAGMRLLLNDFDASIDRGSAVDLERRRLLGTPERRASVESRRPRNPPPDENPGSST